MQPHPKSDMNRSSSYSAQSFPSFEEAATERNIDAIDLRELFIGRLRGFRFGGISPLPGHGANQEGEEDMANLEASAARRGAALSLRWQLPFAQPITHGWGEGGGGSGGDEVHGEDTPTTPPPRPAGGEQQATAAAAARRETEFQANAGATL